MYARLQNKLFKLKHKFFNITFLNNIFDCKYVNINNILQCRIFFELFFFFKYAKKYITGRGLLTGVPYKPHCEIRYHRLETYGNKITTHHTKHILIFTIVIITLLFWHYIYVIICFGQLYCGHCEIQYHSLENYYNKIQHTKHILIFDIVYSVTFF